MGTLTVDSGTSCLSIILGKRFDRVKHRPVVGTIAFPNTASMTLQPLNCKSHHNVRACHIGPMKLQHVTCCDQAGEPFLHREMSQDGQGERDLAAVGIPEYTILHEVATTNTADASTNPTGIRPASLTTATTCWPVECSAHT